MKTHAADTRVVMLIEANPASRARIAARLRAAGYEVRIGVLRADAADALLGASSVRLERAALPAKNLNAAALGRLGGLKGGRARAAALSPRRRCDIARKAARARWARAAGHSTADQ